MKHQSYRKGLTMLEEYGEVHVKRIIQKMVHTRMKNNSYCHSIKTKNKISESCRKAGCGKANKGRKLSGQHKEKIRNKMLGRVLSEGWKKKIGLKNKGLKRSLKFKEECRQRTIIQFKDPRQRENLRQKMLQTLKKMKKQNTLPERNLEQIIKTIGWAYETQKSLCHITISDFYIPGKKLVIYADGDYWHNLPEYKIRDKKQNKILKEKGYKVLRFWEHEINKEPEKCRNILLNTINSSNIAF